MRRDLRYTSRRGPKARRDKDTRHSWSDLRGKGCPSTLNLANMRLEKDLRPAHYARWSRPLSLGVMPTMRRADHIHS